MYLYFYVYSFFCIFYLHRHWWESPPSGSPAGRSWFGTTACFGESDARLSRSCTAPACSSASRSSVSACAWTHFSAWVPRCYCCVLRSGVSLVKGVGRSSLRVLETSNWSIGRGKRRRGRGIGRFSLGWNGGSTASIVSAVEEPTHLFYRSRSLPCRLGGMACGLRAGGTPC